MFLYAVPNTAFLNETGDLDQVRRALVLMLCLPFAAAPAPLEYD